MITPLTTTPDVPVGEFTIGLVPIPNDIGFSDLFVCMDGKPLFRISDVDHASMSSSNGVIKEYQGERSKMWVSSIHGQITARMLDGSLFVLMTDKRYEHPEDLWDAEEPSRA